jgi:hypothetical protein
MNDALDLRAPRYPIETGSVPDFLDDLHRILFQELKQPVTGPLTRNRQTLALIVFSRTVSADHKFDPLTMLINSLDDVLALPKVIPM